MTAYLVWDWNGTLFDDRVLVFEAMAAALAAADYPRPSAEQLQTRFARPLRTFFGRIVGHDLTEQEWIQLFRVFRQTYAERVATAALAPDARETLAAWKATGAGQALVSSWPHEDLVRVVDRHGLTDLFDTLCGRTTSKDKAANISALLRERRLDRRDVVLIGDAREDVKTAHTAGIGVVLVVQASLERLDSAELAALAVPVATSLPEATALAQAAAAIPKA
jgi:phosphoglycolate phosphatase-like HAD superfamily hydrolase